MNREACLASLAVRAAWARGLLAFYMLMCVLHFALGCFLLYFELQVGFSYPNALVTSFTGLMCGGAFILAAVPVSLWLLRASRNLRLFGLENVRFTPWASLASYFIPLANFVFPFWSMRELYNRSNGESHYQANETMPDVSNWWTCFLVGSLILAYLVLITLLDILTTFFVTVPAGVNTAMGLISTVLLGAAAFYLFRIIKAVTTGQHTDMGIAAAFA